MEAIEFMDRPQTCFVKNEKLGPIIVNHLLLKISKHSSFFLFFNLSSCGDGQIRLLSTMTTAPTVVGLCFLCNMFSIEVELGMQTVL